MGIYRIEDRDGLRSDLLQNGQCSSLLSDSLLVAVDFLFKLGDGKLVVGQFGAELGNYLFLTVVGSC